MFSIHSFQRATVKEEMTNASHCWETCLKLSQTPLLTSTSRSTTTLSSRRCDVPASPAHISFPWILCLCGCLSPLKLIRLVRQVCQKQNRVLPFFRQVSEMVTQYNREHLTVWGNSSNEIVRKCYEEVKRCFTLTVSYSNSEYAKCQCLMFSRLFCRIRKSQSCSVCPECCC